MRGRGLYLFSQTEKLNFKEETWSFKDTLITLEKEIGEVLLVFYLLQRRF